MKFVHTHSVINLQKSAYESKKTFNKNIIQCLANGTNANI